jgi:hypothetical protein
MGFWTKESSTHFNRDESGNVVSVERSGDDTSGDYLIQKLKSEHPSRWNKFKTNMKERAADAYMQGKSERQVYREAYNDARLKRARHSGQAAGFDLGTPVYNKPGKPRYVKQNVKADLGGMMGYPAPNYDTYHSHKKKHKTGGKQYDVVGGKAYEKASKSKNHKKKRRKGGNNSFNGGLPNFMNMKVPW